MRSAWVIWVSCITHHSVPGLFITATLGSFVCSLYVTHFPALRGRKKPLLPRLSQTLWEHEIQCTHDSFASSMLLSWRFASLSRLVFFDILVFSAGIVRFCFASLNHLHYPKQFSHTFIMASVKLKPSVKYYPGHSHSVTYRTCFIKKKTYLADRDVPLPVFCFLSEVKRTPASIHSVRTIRPGMLVCSSYYQRFVSTEMYGVSRDLWKQLNEERNRINSGWVNESLLYQNSQLFMSVS